MVHLPAVSLAAWEMQSKRSILMMLQSDIRLCTDICGVWLRLYRTIIRIIRLSGGTGQANGF